MKPHKTLLSIPLEPEHLAALDHYAAREHGGKRLPALRSLLRMYAIGVGLPWHGASEDRAIASAALREWLRRARIPNDGTVRPALITEDLRHWVRTGGHLPTYTPYTYTDLGAPYALVEQTFGRHAMTRAPEDSTVQ